MKKIILINNIISPTCIYICKNINNQLKPLGIDFEVIFLSVSDKNRNWEKEKNIPFKYEVLENFAIRFNGKDLNTFFINTSIIKKLNEKNPDKIICFGWDHFAAYAANYWARKNKKKFLLWSGSTKYEKSWRRMIFKPLVKHLIKKTSEFIAYGTRAKEYLISLGVAPNEIQIFYHAIDFDYFSENLKKFSDKNKDELKKQLGIKTSKTILFSGRLLKMKGIFEMVEGFGKYYKQDNDVSLLIMGTGPDENKLKEFIEKRGIKNIIFTKFIQFKELYKYYAISDLLLFPTRQDIWGLVINEALACGLPVITTEVAGASIDLIEEGKNGYIIKLNSPEKITSSIKKIFENRLHNTNNSWEIIQKTRIGNILEKIKL